MRILFIFAFLFLSFPAAAADIKNSDIKNVEAYLNGISTLQSRFVQTADDGDRVEGVFMMKRPGRLRFEYDAPVTDFIVADGTLIYYYDGQMRQQRSTLISNSLADFFLRPRLKLSGDVSVSDIARKDGLLQITLVQTTDRRAGALTLVFAENPIQLKKWRITDAQGLTTHIDLREIRVGIPLNDRLFHYYDPLRQKPALNK